MRSLVHPVAVAAAVALGWPSAAGAGTLATVPAPTPVSAYGGVVAWSTLDPATGRYALTAAVDGVITRLPVKTRTVPFDVDLGRAASGGVVAAYSRCRVEPGRQQLGNALIAHPDWSTGRGCRLYRYSFTGGREVRLRRSGTASEFLPSIWRDRIAFATVRRGGHPRLWLRDLDAGIRARALPPGARSTYTVCIGGNCHRKRLVREPGPTALDLRGNRLAMTWDSGADGPTSSLYVETIGRRSVDRRRLLAVVSGNLVGQELLGPALDPGGVVWTWARYGEDISATLLRRPLPGGTTRRAMYPPLSDQEIYLRPVLASAVDGDAVTYLASGAPAAPEPGCSAVSRCTAQPGCSPESPCVLQQVTGLVPRRG